MKICIATDAWHPQINGVVRTLQMTKQALEELGHQVLIISPDQFLTIPCPSYADIRLALARPGRMGAMISDFAPDALHIATEGPIGWAARRWCLRHDLPFTTAWHTNFPDYVALRSPIPERWLYGAMRRFHAPSAGIMVATPTVARKLRSKGFGNIRPWSRGVDTALFRPHLPYPDDLLPADLPRPLHLCVGRVAVEKNIEAFLSLDLPGSQIVVGDGPARAALSARYPRAIFTGSQSGEALARLYAAADVFVFPSRTDTFGLVMLEALASGVPVAAFPVEGPLDVIGADGRGVIPDYHVLIGGLDDDLRTAISRALTARPEDCRRYAEAFSWQASAHQFLSHLYVPAEMPDQAALVA
ncbi:GDP-mannose-dependent alpha-mannosyltransferase [alpha proteobacterium Q-1]|nr:GDP-mannose-dependent alpha-mannosyltransferase [alpha proteobacterium Q-1]